MRLPHGFTLVEILVVMAILAVLAAVVIPNVANLVSAGKVKANQAELSIVQTAIDTYMADQIVGAVPAQAAQSNLALTTPALYPNYIRIQNARCSYAWTVSGLVSQSACP